MALIPYVVFSGNCREAMEFYASTFDGEVTSMTTFGESPMPVAEDLSDRIFDSEIKSDDIHFKASDDLPSHSVTKGTNISLFVSFSDKKKRENIFNTLSQDGNVLFPLDDNFGMLTDKYGVQWMFVGA